MCFLLVEGPEKLTPFLSVLDFEVELGLMLRLMLGSRLEGRLEGLGGLMASVRTRKEETLLKLFVQDDSFSVSRADT